MNKSDYLLPPTNLMAWYADQIKKTEVIRFISINAGVSSNYVRQWVRGLAIAKRVEHLDVLSQITHIDKDKLFKFVEP